MLLNVLKHQFAVKLFTERIPTLLPRILTNNAARHFSCLFSRPTIVPAIQNTSDTTSLISERILAGQFCPQLTQTCGFKVKGRLRRRCKDCYFVMRQERLLVLCKTHPRHKQMAMQKKPKNTWILTHATQSTVRPY
jgi:large subunit ribosomal protein L36